MAQKNWFTPSKLLIIAGIILLGLLVWRFSSIVAYILIASVLSLIARPLVRLLGRIKIGKWKVPASIRALVTLVVIWTVLFSFFRLFIPLIASEAQELSNVDTALVVEEFEEPIQHLELWFSKLTLGDDESKAGPGTWVRMEPRLPHSVLAETNLVMLLLMLKE